jgi:hypothetical protein
LAAVTKLAASNSLASKSLASKQYFPLLLLQLPPLLVMAMEAEDWCDEATGKSLFLER